MKSQEPTLKWTIFQVLHSGRLRQYKEILDQAEKACWEQTLQLITKIRKLLPQKLSNIGPRVDPFQLLALPSNIRLVWKWLT